MKKRQYIRYNKVIDRIKKDLDFVIKNSSYQDSVIAYVNASNALLTIEKLKKIFVSDIIRSAIKKHQIQIAENIAQNNSILKN